MIWLRPPTREGYVSSGWGDSRAYRGGWHQGLDFRAPSGAPVLAAADGIVIHVKNVDNSFAGKWVGIKHPKGIYTRYLHNTQNLVTEGQRVSRGQQIATIGQSGTSGAGASHVHFDVKASAPAFEAYKQRYGTPTTGWGKEMKGFGWGIPAETFMTQVSYRDEGKAARARGVVFFQPNILGALAIIGFLGWGAYRFSL